MPQPIVTTHTGRRVPSFPAAIIALVINPDGRFLMLSHPNSNGQWEPINGGMDADETIIECVMREVQEEGGPQIKVRPLGVAHAYTFRYDKRVSHVLSICYLLEYLGGEVIPGDDMVNSEVRWLTVEELESAAYPVVVPRGIPWIFRRAALLYEVLKDQPDVSHQADLVKFAGPKYTKDYNLMQWYNTPPSWQEESDKLVVTSGAKTDFWRVTRHDFIKDDGHFYYQEISGDFTISVKITGQYNSLYDQAGLMVRMDEKTWIKCGIEYVDGLQHASVVVTRDYSDWSVVPLHSHPMSTWIRVRRFGAALEVDYSNDGTNFIMLRECYLTDAKTLQAGMMIAAPRGDGFQTTFEEFSIEARE